MTLKDCQRLLQCIPTREAMSIQFESFKGWKGDSFRGCSPVLVDIQSQEAMMGIHLESQAIRTLEATYYSSLVVISNSHEGPPYVAYRPFSTDQSLGTIEWATLVADHNGPTFFAHFAPRCPLLIPKRSGTRLQICDENGTPLVTMFGVWRDSDIKRHVLKQFEINEPNHPLSTFALISLLHASSDSRMLT